MTDAAGVRDAFHYLYPNELPALQWLATCLPPNPVVINIGAGAGTSGLAFLESRQDLFLVTIDIQDASSPFGCLEAEREVVRAAGLGDDWQKRHFQIHNDSKRVGQIWDELADSMQTLEDVPRLDSVDLVFVDGDHSYEGCKGDIEAWLPHIKPDGFIAVHDYRKSDLAPDPNGPHPKPWPGVDQAVDELLVGRYRLTLRVDSLVAFQMQEPQERDW